MASTKISGKDACALFEVAVADLAQACLLGKIDAYSSVTKKKIVPSSQCRRKFINKRIIDIDLKQANDKFLFINEDIFKYFNVELQCITSEISNENLYTDDEIKNFIVNEACSEIKEGQYQISEHYPFFYFITFKDLDSSIGDTEYDYSKYRVYISKIKKNYNIKMRISIIDDYRSFTCPISIFFEPFLVTGKKDIYPLSNYLWIKEIRTLLNETLQKRNTEIEYIYSPDDTVLNLKHGNDKCYCEMKLNIIDDTRVKSKLARVIDYYTDDEYRKKFHYLYINESYYYNFNDKSMNKQLHCEDYFIFEYDKFLKNSIYPSHMHSYCEEEFKNYINNFLYDRNEIEMLKNEIEINDMIDSSPKGYIIEIYKRNIHKLEEDDKLCVDMYIRKLNGETFDQIIDAYKDKRIWDKTSIGRKIEKVEEISKKLKIPYLPWNIVTPGKTQRDKTVNIEELSSKIKNQLINLK